MVVMIDEVKIIFYSFPVGKGARFRVLWLARLATYGGPFGCADCDVKFNGLLVAK